MHCAWLLFDWTRLACQEQQASHACIEIYTNKCMLQPACIFMLFSPGCLAFEAAYEWFVRGCSGDPRKDFIFVYPSLSASTPAAASTDQSIKLLSASPVLWILIPLMIQGFMKYLGACIGCFRTGFLMFLEAWDYGSCKKGQCTLLPRTARDLQCSSCSQPHPQLALWLCSL